MAKLIRQGFVHLKHAITVSEQNKIFELSRTLTNKFSHSTESRLRIYDRITNFPDDQFLLGLASRSLNLSNAIDNSLIEISPTHLIFLKYLDGSNIPYHSDISENDGEGNYPIVSLSVGKSCDFGIKYRVDDKYREELLKIESGDAIVFGGESRYIFHSVKRVYNNEFPYRLNLTFRYTPNIFGKEHLFKTFTKQDYLKQPQLTIIR